MQATDSGSGCKVFNALKIVEVINPSQSLYRHNAGREQHTILHVVSAHIIGEAVNHSATKRQPQKHLFNC